MKRGVRRFLVSAAACLVLGLMLQAANLADLWLGFNPFGYTSANLIAQVLLIGWLSQAVFGLLYYAVVRSSRGEVVVWACLNLGLALALVGQPLMALTGSDLAGGLLAVGGVLQLAGGVVFVVDLVTALRKSPPLQRQR
jgi:hypothetical protein